MKDPEMNCFHCNTCMVSGGADWATWGNRQVIVHRRCERSDLVAYASELGVFPVDDPNRTDEQLIAAIAAEKLAGEWLDRFDQLSSDEEKRAAIHRLRLSMDAAR